MSKKKKHKQWSRDTKFERYAAQFWRDLDAAFAIEGVRVDRYRGKTPEEVACPVLAKRLYDFAEHVTENMVFTFVKDIPDLSQTRTRREVP